MRLKECDHTVTDTMVLFFGGPFSQWAKCEFVIRGVKYNCTEQYMMAEKARTFGDVRAEMTIMASNDPSQQKFIGRQVQKFDAKVWDKKCKHVVYLANMAKFSQNEGYFNVLRESEGLMLVEASPYDKIWGIGLAEDDPKAQDLFEWKGENWLGEVLVAVRRHLVEGRIHEFHR